MSVNDDRLTKEELQYLIEELSLSDDEPATTLLESSTAFGELPSDLKERLQRRLESTT